MTPTIISGIEAAVLDVDALVETVRNEGAGAVVVFEGTTRNGPHEGDVVALDYEVYENLAARQLRELAETAVDKWSLLGAVVVHRSGYVPVGGCGVLIVAVAEHGPEAFEATQWLIDTLKATAAIWKRECYADGSSAWI